MRRRSKGSRWWSRWASVKTGGKPSWAYGKERRRTRRWLASYWATWWSAGSISPSRGSTFSIVEQVCRNVKRWHGGDQRERWVGSGLLVAEKQFNRVQGYKQIPALIKELDAWTPSKVEVVKRRKAS